MQIRLGLVLAGLLTASLSALPALAAPSTGDSPGSDAAPRLSWKEVDLPTSVKGSDQSLRGLAVGDRNTAWVSGDEGGVFATDDGGRTWRDVAPPGARAKKLFFRDIELVSRDVAHVLAIGERGKSRIYKTTDGGETWRMTFRNREKSAFYDCFSFWPGGERGIAMSDPVDGAFRILSTDDGGASWQVGRTVEMPAAVEGEFGFAASGTCLVTGGRDDVWLASGGAASRIYFSRDGGQTWTVRTSPIAASEAGGTFSLAFANPRRGIAVGGDFEVEDDGVDRSAYTRDGGRTWRSGGDLGGYRSGVAFLPYRAKTAVAVGPNGSDVTTDGGRTWETFSDTGFHSVACGDDGACWASGSEGRVARLRVR